MIQFYKALSDETRLKIAAILSMGEFSVYEITRILKMGQSRVSRHLKILNDAQIAGYRRDGAKVYYSVIGEPDTIQSSVTDLTIKWYKQETPDWTDVATSVEDILESRRSKSRLFFAEVGQDWSALLAHFIDQKVFVGALRKKLGGIQKLADLGCGPGFVIKELSSSVQHLIGVDYSDKMLDHARRNLRELVTQGKVELRLGAIEHLPMCDNEVDGVLINLVLHHIAEPHGLFSELKRVLKKGGQLSIVEFEKHDNEHFRDEMADTWLGFDARDLSVWLRNAGFKRVKVQEFPGGKNDVKLVLAQGYNTE
jgi:SAM-dependent methyltransferase